MMASVTQPAYLEPRTDVPAVDDWSTKLFLDEGETQGRVGSTVAVGPLTAAVSLVVFPESAPGTVAAVVVLALLGLLTAIGSLAFWHDSAPRRRGLLDRPWRRVPATVAAGGTWTRNGSSSSPRRARWSCGASCPTC
jgi:hypothetical protein